jgi:formylglycine-generating enzyme
MGKLAPSLVSLVWLVVHWMTPMSDPQRNHKVFLAPPDPGEHPSCPADMRLVASHHHDRVEQMCTKWEGKHCVAYERNYSISFGPAKPMRFCMDQYEAPNQRGAKPLVMKNFDEAEAWCGSHGKRICSEFEWETACESGQELPYQYGWSMDTSICNSDKVWHPFNDAALRAGGTIANKESDRLWQGLPSGTMESCRSVYGIHDLLGNVEEWVATSRPRKYRGVLMGGFWAKGWTGCRGTNDAHDTNFRFYEVGFRCCQSASEANKELVRLPSLICYKIPVELSLVSQPTTSQPPSPSAIFGDQRWLRQILVWSVLHGLCPLLPIPFLDDILAYQIRKHVIQKICRHYESPLSILQLQLVVTDPHSNKVLGCFWAIFIYPVKKIFRKIFFVLSIKDCIDQTSMLLHWSLLLDHAFRNQWVTAQSFADPQSSESALHLTHSIHSTCKLSNTSPVTQLLKRSFLSSKLVFLAFLTSFVQLWRKNKGSPNEDQRLEQAMEQSESASSPAFHQVMDELGKNLWSKDSYFTQLFSTFEQLWQSTQPAQPQGGNTPPAPKLSGKPLLTFDQTRLNQW